MSKVAIGIIEAGARDDLKKAKTLEEKVNIVFKVAKNHWMFTEENDQFTGAVGAILMHCTDDEKEILIKELEVIKALKYD